MSKTKLKSINHSIYTCMKPLKTSLSYATYSERVQRLKVTFKDLHKLGYEITQVNRIKPKHISNLVNYWQHSGLAIGSIKNRMADLRFICQIYNRNHVVQSNDDYQIGQRTYVPTHNKAQYDVDFTQIEDPYLRCSLELQRVFGLRREECLKVKPHLADDGNLLRLKASWTKGGIARAIPIRTQAQRDWLTQAKKLLTQSQSLIPDNKTYIQQRRYYDRITHQAGFKNLHGLRHAYAQQRYFEITGWQAPINGGRKRNQLSLDEKYLDRRARKIIAIELGHSRWTIVKNYCGK